MSDIKSIIRRIRDRRIFLDYSYQDLANKTGLSKSTLQRYETGGIGNLPLDKLEVIAKALDVSPAYIMGWEEEPEPDIHTIAAHALEELTEEEQEKVLEYAKFIKAMRSKNEK